MTDLVLLGGGHAHVAVVKRFGMKPAPGVRVTLVSRDVDTPYSGMLPGLIAGHYTHDDAHIDLQRLTRFAGVVGVFDEVVGLDCAGRTVHCRNRPPIRFDLLSINIGSTPNASVRGASDHAIPVKPIDRFLRHWEALRGRLLADDAPKRVAVVGGGAGGVELLLSVQYRMRTLLEAVGRRDAHIDYHLFTAGTSILPSFNARARRMVERILSARGVRVHTGSPIAEVRERRVLTAAGESHEVDEILWTTQARAASWLAASGLAADEDGFVRVADTLQSTSHPGVFAAGDAASMVGSTLEKSGVYAVRQGRVLAANLQRAVRGERLHAYRPQRRFLSLLSTGDRHAVASRGRFALEGPWMWRWKDAIDRRFMRQYNELPEMRSRATAPDAPDSGRQVRRRADQPMRGDAAAGPGLRTRHADDDMRCGGCGAKVGSDVLARALRRVQAIHREDVLVGLDARDDAAVVEVPACKAMVHSVDFFRAIVADPYVFGKIAASHALGDLYAMGADPQTALAIVTIPPGPEQVVEDTLTQLMAGALGVLREAGAALAGGHTSEGAELGLGFAVNGLVDRDRIMRKGGLQPGDCLVLTKPIGTGTLFAADMRHRARGRWISAALASMTQSNREASRSLLQHGVTACTDVTGFGLLGHLVEMLNASHVDAELDVRAVPLLDGAEETVGAGFVSSLHPDNLRLRRAIVNADEAGGTPRGALIFDPQTAGGLLAGVRPDTVESCVADLRAAGYGQAAVIGTARPRAAGGSTGQDPPCVRLA